MTNETETTFSIEEAEALILRAERMFEYEDALLSAKGSFEAYWAGSAVASVERDYRAGRVVNIYPKAG